MITPVMARIRLACDWTADAQPGQFVNVAIGEAGFFLRRPISIADAGTTGGQGWIDLMVQDLGAGSRWMMAQPVGASINLLGPLGNTWDLAPRRRSVLIAGGVGIAPVLWLRDHWTRSRARVRAELWLGARNASLIPDEPWTADTDGNVRVFTDDGSRSEKGYPSNALGALPDGEAVHVYACGPTPMLRAVMAVVAEKRSAKQDWIGEVSVEEHMGCGFGVCFGCVIDLVDANQKLIGRSRSCVEGPVYAMDRIRV
jgi:dihydroorotate dehydrogenase electron transfer subunit